MLWIQTLVEDRSLELAMLVGDPASKTEVSWVHNTELLDPSPYLGRQELVLTNGLWRADAQSSSEFVANVARAEASGIVYGLRQETPQTPADLIDACRRADLPLLEISAAVPFTAVSHAVAAAYAEQRQEMLVDSIRRGDALADALSRGAGAAGVLRVLRRDHDLPLAVVDRMGRLLATERAPLSAEQRDAVAECLTRHPPPLEVELGSGPATLFLVNALGDVDAALVCLRPMSVLTQTEREALTQAARFLSLEVAKTQAVQAIETRFASELLDMVLSGAQRAAEVPGRLRAFGIDAADPMAVLAFTFAGLAADAGTATMPGLAEAGNRFLTGNGIRAVVAGGSGDVVAVLSWRRPAADLNSLAHRLAKALDTRFTGHDSVVGIGDVAMNASGLRRSLVAAREACRVLRDRPQGTRVAAFTALGTYRLLLGLHDRETLRRFAEPVLDPIRESDRSRGTELEATLSAFLQHDGHWGNTAAALYIHVNTLRNRLARITQLTGLDVSRTVDRVDLFLALEADSAGGAE